MINQSFDIILSTIHHEHKHTDIPYAYQKMQETLYYNPVAVWYICANPVRFLP